MTRFELGRTERYEPWLLRQFDHTLVTSAQDRQALLALAGPSQAQLASRVHVVPIGVDLAYFGPGETPRMPASLVLSGKMSYHANITAARHLIQEIMPAVWQRRPDVQVWIVGKDPGPAIRALADGASDVRRVIVTGTVPDIRPYLRQATVAVAPIPYGAGIQNKVLEAMACGAPVIASAQAVAALQVRAGHDLVVAGDAQDFARQILGLLDAPARRQALAQAGRAYVEEQHAWAGCGVRLEQIYALAGMDPTSPSVRCG
jgi:glycosyltransferase involved in cell wall biosynthesis